MSEGGKVWPVQAVKIESVVNCAAVHKGMKSTSRPSSRPSTSTQVEAGFKLNFYLQRAASRLARE